MKQKLTEEKALEIFNQIEFPKSLQKVILKKIRFNPYRPRANSRWKDYTLYLYARERLENCRMALFNKILDNIEITQFLLSKDLKNRSKKNWDKIKKNTRDHLAMSYALIEGFGIYMINKKYVVKEFPDQFIKEFNKKFKKAPSAKTRPRTRLIFKNFKDTRSLIDIKKSRDILVFPSKREAIKNVLKRDDYKKSQKLAQKENVTNANESPEIFYKRIFKIEEPKYNLKWFINYTPSEHRKKYRVYLTNFWKLYLKIR